MTINFYDNSWRVRVGNKQYSYSISTYGSKAKKMAEYSNTNNEKLNNWFEHLENNVTIIYLKNKKDSLELKCYIDTEDFSKIKDYHWSAYKVKNEYYAQSFKNGKRTYMHRLIMETPDNLVVDHINGNGLNNVKSNLRNVTKQQNSSNRVNVPSNNKYGINGIKDANGGKDIQVTWIDATGKRKSKTFSINKYGGKEKTLNIAKKFRENILSESSNYIKNEESVHNDN